MVVRDSAVVARSGEAPLAWRRRDKFRGPGETSAWKPCRPAIDGLLRPTDVLQEAFRSGVRDAMARFRDPELVDKICFMLPSPSDDLNPERTMRRWLVGKRRGMSTSAPAYVFADEPPGDNWDRFSVWRDLWEKLDGHREPPARTNLLSRLDHIGEQRRLWLRLGRKMREIYGWLDGFPPGALDFVERQGFVERRWHLLNLWIRVPDARQWMEDIPALAWLAASSWCFRDQPVCRPLRSLRSLARKPRKNLLSWLGFAGGEGTLRLLSRVSGSDLDRRMIKPLQQILRDPRTIHSLLNLPGTQLRRETLAIAGWGNPVSFPILAAINEGHTFDCGLRLADCHRDIMRMAAQLGDDQALARLATVRSPARLHDLHQRLVLATRLSSNQWLSGVASAWRGPISPPLPHHPSWVTPLETLADLFDEAEAMQHCALSFAEEILRGGAYLYRINHPAGRATLSIRPTTSNPESWQLDQLYGPLNAPVDPALRHDVETWLQEARRTLSQSRTPGDLQDEGDFRLAE